MYSFSIFEPLNYFERSSIKRAFSNHITILVKNLQGRNQSLYPRLFLPLCIYTYTYIFIFITKIHLKLFYWTTLLKYFLFFQSSEAAVQSVKELISHIGSYIRLKVCFEFLWSIFVNKVVCHRILIDLFTNSACLSQFCVNGQSIFC